MKLAIMKRRGLRGAVDPITAQYDEILATEPAVLFPMNGADLLEYRGQHLYWQDAAGTVKAENIGDPVGGAVDIVAGEILAVQDADANRLVLGEDSIIVDTSGQHLEFSDADRTGTRTVLADFHEDPEVTDDQTIVSHGSTGEGWTYRIIDDDPRELDTNHTATAGRLISDIPLGRKNTIWRYDDSAGHAHFLGGSQIGSNAEIGDAGGEGGNTHIGRERGIGRQFFGRIYKIVLWDSALSDGDCEHLSGLP